MDAAALVARLAAGRDAIPALLAGVDGGQARWRPAPEQWSLLEIACHLLDEERDDFRARVDLTLHRPDEPWPGIDPPGWVTARRYQERAPLDAVRGGLVDRTEARPCEGRAWAAAPSRRGRRARCRGRAPGACCQGARRRYSGQTTSFCCSSQQARRPPL